MTEFKLPSISRSQFKDAIESGIQSADLSDEAAARLRALGDTVSEVAYGTFWDDTTACKCPLYATGLVSKTPNDIGTYDIEASEDLIAYEEIGPFYSVFDCAVTSALRVSRHFDPYDRRRYDSAESVRIAD